MRKGGEIQKSNREGGKDEHTVYIYGNVIIELNYCGNNEREY